MSNSRGAQALARLIEALKPGALPATPEQAAAAGDLVVEVQPLAGKIVIDASNYYPPRDGPFAAIDNRDTGEAKCSPRTCRPPGSSKRSTPLCPPTSSSTPARQAPPTDVPYRSPGDDHQAKAAVTEFIDQIGFDAIDIGSLVQGRSIDPMDAWVR